MKPAIICSIIVMLSTSVSCEGPMRPAQAQVDVNSLEHAVQLYHDDERRYPGDDLTADPSRNDLPVLIEALLGEGSSGNMGVRRSTYLSMDVLDVAVWDQESQKYRKADQPEIGDPACRKYFVDPWGNPYVYRVNAGKPRQPWMRNPEGFDIYSVGANGVDDTVKGSRGSDDDDIGNW